MKRLASISGVAVVAWIAVVSAAPLNVTGSWQPKYWTLKISLHQEGDRVSGFGGAKDFWFRGQWDGNRLILVANNFDPRRPGPCKPRGVFLLAGTTVTSLSTVWFQEPERRQLKGPWTRLSPDAGDEAPYPYAAELTSCGVLRTYELVFATGSDQLQGTGWPILAAVGDLLKQNGAMKIQIGGHTDSTGDPAKNQQLSEARAATVKQTLVATYAADATRITTKGWGAEQPIAENTTEDGRALNRRVEIVLGR